MTNPLVCVKRVVDATSEVVLTEDDLARRVDDALDADQWVGHLMRSLEGSRSGVASTEPTVTG